MIIKQNNYCKYKLDNCRSILLETVDTPEILYNVVEHNKIEKLIFPKFTQSINDVIEFEFEQITYKYHIKHIEKLENILYQLLCEKRNKTTMYLLPCLAGNNIRKASCKVGTTSLHKTIKDSSEVYWMIKDYMLNTYLSEDFNCLYLTYRYFNHESYLELERDLIKRKDFVEKIDNNDLVTFKLVIPKEHKQDAHLFMKGKYSQMSLGLKHKIKAFYGLNDNQELMKILYKSKVLKQAWEQNLGVEIESDLELDNKPNRNEIWNAIYF